MSTLKTLLLKMLIVAGLLLFIDFAWAGLELLFYGELHGSPEDGIIGGMLAMSLYYNLRIKIHSGKSD